MVNQSILDLTYYVILVESLECNDSWENMMIFWTWWILMFRFTQMGERKNSVEVQKKIDALQKGAASSSNRFLAHLQNPENWWFVNSYNKDTSK